MESEIARTGGAGGTNLLPLSRFHFLEGTRVTGITIHRGRPPTTQEREMNHIQRAMIRQSMIREIVRKGVGVLATPANRDTLRKSEAEKKTK